jgi:hypothetical protein
VPDAGISQKAPTGRADPCHKAPARASARPAREVLKKRQNQGSLPANGFRTTSCGPIGSPISSPNAASALIGRITTSNRSFRWPFHFDGRELPFADLGGKGFHLQGYFPARAILIARVIRTGTR